jgi:transposase InsO family protein
MYYGWSKEFLEAGTRRLPYLKITGWGWYYLSTVLDDFSRYIVAWKLCATMGAEDVTATLDLALSAAGLDHVNVGRRPRLLLRAFLLQRTLGSFCKPNDLRN